MSQKNNHKQKETTTKAKNIPHNNNVYEKFFVPLQPLLGLMPISRQGNLLPF